MQGTVIFKNSTKENNKSPCDLNRKKNTISYEPNKFFFPPPFLNHNKMLLSALFQGIPKGNYKDYSINVLWVFFVSDLCE